MTTARRVLLWMGLLALSVAVHLLLSWRAGHGLKQPVAVEETRPPEAELSLAPVEEQKPEPLFFEEPLEFEPPAILVAGTSELPPPPAVAGGAIPGRRYHDRRARHCRFWQWHRHRA